jgi:glucosamine-6-phosphate deaminase
MIDPRDLYEWCRVPARDLEAHPRLRVRFRLVADAAALGRLMATELADLIDANNRAGQPTRAIVPCGPRCWYEPFAEAINGRRISLGRLVVFHMDECLDWQGRLLPPGHPYNFRTFMERHFYDVIDPPLAVPEEQRFWLTPDTAGLVAGEIRREPVDVTIGGWGQDGHVAYNQAPRSPYVSLPLDTFAASTIRVQRNNVDTILALAHRTFGAAYQFVPPMSITLGLAECFAARRIRVYSDTGAWKQTALRVALFGDPTTEYPITLLQRHPDAIITATLETATHPIAEHPEWELF